VLKTLGSIASNENKTKPKAKTKGQGEELASNPERTTMEHGCGLVHLFQERKRDFGTSEIWV
jgi:hypothetical protein